MRSSPHAKTPPVGMSAIPGITSASVVSRHAPSDLQAHHGLRAQKPQSAAGKDEKDELFEMEN